MAKQAVQEDARAQILEDLFSLLQADDFPGKLVPEQIEKYRPELARYSIEELTVLLDVLTKEIETRRKAGKTLLISKIEDITARAKVEDLLKKVNIEQVVIDNVLQLIVNKCSNFNEHVFNGKVDDLFSSSVQDAIVNVLLERAVIEGGGGEGGSSSLKKLIEVKVADAQTFVRMINTIDQSNINEDLPVKYITLLNLLAEALKRDEMMVKSETITMKDLINFFLLSKMQLFLSKVGFTNEIMDGIVINRIGQSNNIKRQFEILERVFADVRAKRLDPKEGFQAGKADWLRLINEYEIDVALDQYNTKLEGQKRDLVDSTAKYAVKSILMTDNIADQTIGAISFARRLDNPDESMHDAYDLETIAKETHYLTSLIFQVKGLQIKEVYEFIETIGELDKSSEDQHKIMENLKFELPFIDKGILKGTDSDLRKAALAARYLIARLMTRFKIDAEELVINADDIRINRETFSGSHAEEKALALKYKLFSEIRKRISFFNDEQRAFRVMNQVEELIEKKKLKLDKAGQSAILEATGFIELDLAVERYVKKGTITKGNIAAADFTVKMVQEKIRSVFGDKIITKIEKVAMEKSIIPESILQNCESDEEYQRNILDIKSYAIYLLTRRFDKPEYPRHLQRAMNLIYALIEDAIGWRYFEITQLKIKDEVVPLLEEYNSFLKILLKAVEKDTNEDHAEAIGKLRDDESFALIDNKESLEGGKKSASQVKVDFFSQIQDVRFQTYVAQTMKYADELGDPDWKKYREELEATKAEVKTKIEQSARIIERAVKDIADGSPLEPQRKVLKDEYLAVLADLKERMMTDRTPSRAAYTEFENLVENVKFENLIKTIQKSK